MGGWKPDQPCCQEYELYLRLLIGQKYFGFSSEIGAVYRDWGGTLSKRSNAEAPLRRLENIDRLEDHLRKIGQLTPKRFDAINQDRFSIARLLWQFNPMLAGKIMDDVRVVDPRFSPTGVAAPAHYRLAFHSLGFKNTERLAALMRRLKPRPSAKR